MAKGTKKPEIEDREFTSAEEIDQGIERLRKRIEEVNALKADRVNWRNARVEAVETIIDNTIREVFGPKSHLYAQLRGFDIYRQTRVASEQSHQVDFERAIPGAVERLEGLIGILKEKRQYLPEPKAPASESLTARVPSKGSRKVFVVHGRDEAAKEAVARFLMKLELTPVILHEQANAGRTIIEKFEKHADVGFAVILLTPDDRGALSPESDLSKFEPRARQNVVFEFGYFVGRLGRTHVCPLYKKGVELPSDVDGLGYIELDAGGAWQLLLAKEIKEAGIEVDMNRAL